MRLWVVVALILLGKGRERREERRKHFAPKWMLRKVQCSQILALSSTNMKPTDIHSGHAVSCIRPSERAYKSSSCFLLFIAAQTKREREGAAFECVIFESARAATLFPEFVSPRSLNTPYSLFGKNWDCVRI